MRIMKRSSHATLIAAVSGSVLLAATPGTSWSDVVWIDPVDPTGLGTDPNSAANLTAKDIDFLHFTSGYTYMGSDTTSSQCPVSQSPDTVNTCLTLKNTSGVAYDAQNPATVGKFDYDSGHLENHASQLGGIGGILKSPEVLWSLDPLLGLGFLYHSGWTGFVVLGAVFLAVTGAEALYADVGHFGARPIRIAWFGLVLPGLFLNYLGQGALVLHDPKNIENPFYLLAPHWALYLLVGLATAATVIASQALISGAFSLTIQAIQLGYLPRMAVKHTSSTERGQVYLPHINWALMLACIGLVLGFRSSSNMAAAYGIAVTLTMLSTTVLFFFAARRLWGWNALEAAAACSVFLVLETGFFAANLVKVPNGGWFPLAMGLVIFVLMATWKRGRELVWNKLRPASMPLEMFLDEIDRNRKVPRVPGTAVFMTANPEGTPIALLHNLKHNKVLHERNLILTILTDEVPQVDAAKRLEVEKLAAGFQRIIAHYGFMEEPNVPELLASAPLVGEPINLHRTTFFLSRETIVPTKSGTMRRWRQWLFSVMSRNAQSAGTFYRIPANRVIELGMQVEI